MSNASGIESVAVVGGGLMGSGIAESVAVAGIPVVLRDVDEVGIGRARDRIESSLARAVGGGKLDAAQASHARERIELTTELEAIAGADLVIEAVPENLDLKLEVMQGLDRAAGSDCVIASNTSSIPIAELAHAVHLLERVLGLHFFSPVPVMKLVVMAAVRMYAEGFARREDIDMGMKLGCGHPMGPLTRDGLVRIGPELRTTSQQVATA